MKRPHILLLGHYPLDALDRAPKVRTYQMARALAHCGTLTVMTGTRRQRARFLKGALRRKLLDTVDLVYVESGSSTATWADVAFLRAVRRRQIPLGIFIRDAYQRFPALYPQTGIKRTVLKILYDITLAQYRQLASVIYTPTRGLAETVGVTRPVLLPPGGEWQEKPSDVVQNGRQLIYVGANGPHDGVGRLAEAMSRLAQSHVKASLILVLRQAEYPKAPPSAAIRVVQAQGEVLSRYLWESSVAVIPRHDTVYNRLALPVKFFDYLSHGLPVIVTGPSEVADIVQTHQLGWVCGDSAKSLATTLERALKAVEEREQYRQNAYRYIAQATWRQRAETVIQSLWSDSVGTAGSPVRESSRLK